MIDGLKVWNKWGPISGSLILNVSRVIVRLQSSARLYLGLVNKRSKFMKFLRAKIFFKANP